MEAEIDDADIEIVCFDCDVLTPTVVLGDERAALQIAQDHSDCTGHHLVVQRWTKARCRQLWNIQPACPTDH